MLYVTYKKEDKLSVLAVCLKSEEAIDNLLDNSYGSIISVQAVDYELDFIGSGCSFDLAKKSVFFNNSCSLN